MKTRSMFLLTAVLVLALMSLACRDASETSRERPSAEGGLDTRNPFRIASPRDETGNFAISGEQFSAGLEAAVAKINAEGGILGRQVVVDYRDTKSDPAIAAQVLSEMLADKRYHAVIPSTYPAQSSAMLPIINRAKVLGMTAVGDPRAADPRQNPYFFELALRVEDQARATGCLVSSFGKGKRVAIIAGQEPFALAEIDIWKQQIPSMGNQLVAVETFPLDQLDVSAQLQRIKQQNPDIIVTSAFFNALRSVLEGLKNLGYTNVQVVGDANVTTTVPDLVLQNRNVIPDGMVAMAWEVMARPHGQETPRQRAAIDAISSQVGTISNALYLYLFNYDALHLVKYAAEKAGSDDSDAMIRALESLHDSPAEAGTILQQHYAFSPEFHGVTDPKFYIVDYRAPVENGTFYGLGEIPTC